MIDSQLSPSIEYMEALLVHNPDSSLHLQLPETPLSQTTPLTIGRQAGAHLLIDEGSVSRRHAVISYINKQYMVQDLGSTNGTFVNNERVELVRPCILQPNDTLRVGNTVTFRFLLRSSSPGSTSRTGNRSSALQPDETTARLKRVAQDQPVLNADGTLSSPGIEKPVPASVVATFKEVPALIILPTSSGGATSTPPWVYLLKPNRLIAIGRERGNSIELGDPVVSRRHAELFLASNGCYIRDMGSSNGVIINQIRIERPHRLSHGDRIKLGETVIFFIDLQAGREPTDKHPSPASPIEHNEQKVPPIYNGTVRTPLTSNSVPGTNTSYLTAALYNTTVRNNETVGTPPASSSVPGTNISYLTAFYNEVVRTPPALNSAPGAGTSHLAATYKGAAQNPLTRKMTTVQPTERRVGVVICPRCGVANTQVARFCASCSTPLIP